jgi:hypothetical protein
MVIIASHLASTATTVEYVIIQIGVAKAHFKLKVYSLGEHKGIAISNTSTIGIALVTLIAKNREVCSEYRDIIF